MVFLPVEVFFVLSGVITILDYIKKRPIISIPMWLHIFGDRNRM